MNPEDLITRQKISREKLQRAKEMRREMTPAETKLWTRLRANRLMGYHFRRQQIIEPYIVDFYCHEVGLVVEVDGSIHLEQEEYDRQRDQHLQESGLYVLHFTNADVMKSLDVVLEEIYRVCQEMRQKKGI